MEAFNRKTQDELNRILGSDLSEMEKLIQTFDWTTRRIIEVAQYEIDLARAMHDDGEVIKQEIKMSTVKLVRGIFQTCYLGASGSRTRLWKE